MNSEQNSVQRLWRRREILRVGGLGAIGLSLPQFLAAQESTQEISRGRADACIVIFLNGGPSHLDMWDMKPHAPADIRGEFAPIASSLTGVQLCEHLPRLARHMHRVSLIRSMNHSVNNSHAAAVYAALTGHDRGEQGGGAKPTDHPPPGAMVAKLLSTRGDSLPYVSLPYKTKEGAGGPLQPGFLAGMVGASYDPFWVLDDPSAPSFHVQNLSLPDQVSAGRMSDRRRLLTALDAGRDGSWNMGLKAMNDFQLKAFDLLTTSSTQKAFELDKEPSRDRDRYGRNAYGQSVLLARRLIEAGTRFVTVSWAPDANATWDTHGDNFTKLRTTLLPQFDAACSSLLEDLDSRNLLDRTLVAVLGDFGRTPKVNAARGRDHWNACYSVMLAGGGIKNGFVLGASDRIGALPIESPVSPGDIIATIYHLLGISPDHIIYDTLNRPHALIQNGRIVKELIG